MEAAFIIRNINTENFIGAIRVCPAIWDKRLSEYNDKIKKSEAWWEVARKFHDEFDYLEPTQQNAFVKDLRKKWKNLRQCYKRERDSQVPKSGSAKKKKVKYVYYDILSFLAPVFTTKPTHSNIGDAEQGDDEEEEEEEGGHVEGATEEVETESNDIPLQPSTAPKKRKRASENPVADICAVLKRSLEAAEQRKAEEKKPKKKKPAHSNIGDAEQGDDDEEEGGYVEGATEEVETESTDILLQSSTAPKKRKRASENPVADLCLVLKRSLEATEQRKAEERERTDEDTNFMMSLLNYIRPVQGLNKLAMRSEILQVVTKYYNMTEQPQHFYPPSSQRHPHPRYFSHYPSSSYIHSKPTVMNAPSFCAYTSSDSNSSQYSELCSPQPGPSQQSAADLDLSKDTI